jgi:hypothetical protein
VARKVASKKLEDLTRAFNTTVVMRVFQGPYISLYHDGVENRMEVTTGGRNSPPYLIPKQWTPLGFALSISKENPMTGGLGSTGLFKDVEVGDPASPPPSKDAQASLWIDGTCLAIYSHGVGNKRGKG